MIPQKGASGDLYRSTGTLMDASRPFWTDRFLVACLLAGEWALFVALVEAHALGFI
jgi:hypothetical protein